MQANDRARAVVAATAVAQAHGLTVDDAHVLNDSNKLTVRLLPCDTVARIAPADQQNAAFELDVALGLAQRDAPVAAPDPRVGRGVHARDGLVVTFWTHYDPAGTEVTPATYADALGRLHAGMRTLDVPAPHVITRIDGARHGLADPALTPGLNDVDRRLLATTVESTSQAIAESGAPEQVLHGEPHPGNLLAAPDGPRFIDFETCCRGPVEFDVAHAPEDVAALYPGLDHDLLRQCRLLVLAMITTWRFDPGDALPDGARLADEWLARLRESSA